MYKSIQHLVFAFICLCAISLHAQSPKISIQSTLKDITGKAIPDGAQSVIFRLYSAQTGGTALWEESTTVEVVGGIYSHKLGSVTPLNPSNFGGALYLGVTVAGGQELSPRTELTAAPFAVSVKSIADFNQSAGFLSDGTLNVTGNMKVNGQVTSSINISDLSPWEFTIGGSHGLTRSSDNLNLFDNGQGRLLMYDNGVNQLFSHNSNGTEMFVNGNQKFRTDAFGTVTEGRHYVSGNLDVPNGNINVTNGNLNVSNGNGSSTRWITLGDSDSGIRTTGDGVVQLMSNTLPGLTLRDWNRVGINNENPAVTFHVSGPKNDGYSNNYVGFSHFSGSALTSYENNNNQPLGNAENTNDIIAYFEGGVVSNLSFYAAVNNNFSDIRTKNVIGQSNSLKDLALINKIKITDYTMKDNIRDNKPYKKVIAQEIKEIYPQAISTTRSVLPDIFAQPISTKFENKLLELTLEKDHGLKPGDHIDLLSHEVKLTDVEVIEIKDSKTFKIKSDKELTKIFVYGKYVNDFLSVDYDAISMLNVSATQELHKKIVALENENKALKSATASLEDRMAKIEAMLTSNSSSTTNTSDTSGQK